MNDWKEGHQHKIHLINVGNGDLLAKFHYSSDKWENYFRQLLNSCIVDEFKHHEIHTAEPLVPERRLIEFEISIGKLEKRKCLGSVQLRLI
jgi:hypothetical protein